ncbi:P-loop containing nucleoside triphosphate hydrolase protein [Boletus reticuloceps]|uniref:Gluconokinase n=1 Tax=Boletus reticuloceps TaxID=495285 RepID=A0A8I2YU61_9AGAM|nr:P-loop containing nucleoside triphosphate hydrolase protein [Boletus reticuloceps]
MDWLTVTAARVHSYSSSLVSDNAIRIIHDHRHIMASSSTATEKARNGRGPTPPTLRNPNDAPPSPSLRATSINRDATGARIIVVMGVSGTGKSTLGRALARATHMPFIDGDDLHPATNVAKMTRGEPLEDEDRLPWLETIRRTAVACVLDQVGEEAVEAADGVRWLGVIVACSSLKKTYRAVLRGEGVQTLSLQSLPTYVVYLKGERDVLLARMVHRQGHFMKADMLASQLDTLESPEGEPGVVTVTVDMSTEEQVQRVVQVLGGSS